MEPAQGSGGEAGGTHQEAQLAEFLGTQGSPALGAEAASRHLTLGLKSSLAQGLEEIPLFLEGEWRGGDASEPQRSRFSQGKPKCVGFTQMGTTSAGGRDQVQTCKESRPRPVSRDPWTFSCDAHTG